MLIEEIQNPAAGENHANGRRTHTVSRKRRVFYQPVPGVHSSHPGATRPRLLMAGPRVAERAAGPIRERSDTA
jgi:hypothetical protein